MRRRWKSLSIHNNSISEHSTINRKYLMENIRKHEICHDIKNEFEITSKSFDFVKQKSGFSLPKIQSKCKKRFIRFSTLRQYISEHNREFKVAVSDHLFSKVLNTKRKCLLDYPPLKHFENYAGKLHNKNKLCSLLVLNHLTETITTRRAEWNYKCKYHFHVIGDLAKELLAKEK